MQSVGRIIGPPIKSFCRPETRIYLQLLGRKKRREREKNFLYPQTHFPLLDTSMLLRELKSFKSLIFRALKFCESSCIHSPSLSKETLVVTRSFISRIFEMNRIDFSHPRKIYSQIKFSERRIEFLFKSVHLLLRHVFSSSIFNSFSFTFQPTMQALSYFHPYPILVTLVIYYQSDISAFITVIEILHIFLTKINSFLGTVRGC